MFGIIKTAVTSGVGRQILTLKTHSPAIMFGAGMVGFVATTVLSSRATLKLTDVLEQAEKDRGQADEALALGKDEYTEKDRTQDLRKIKIRAAVQVAKLYAPSVAVGLGSLALLAGSHVTLTRRNVAVTAAYATLERAYHEYRARVREQIGDEREKDLYYGLVEKDFVRETDDGPVLEVGKGVGPNGIRSEYAIKFDKENPNWRPSNDMNEMFLENVQSWATNRLRSRGYLFLNDVHKELGVELTEEGQAVGWFLNNGGDDVVSFTRNESGYLYITGQESAVWLDPNVDGLISNKLPSKLKKAKKAKAEAKK